MAKVIKSIYYPRSDIFKTDSLKVKCKPSDSWMWKSWNSAVELIEEGSGWNVGNGASIKIWEDYWIPASQWKFPFTPRPEGCSINKVHGLMNQGGGGGWNQAVIRNLFSEKEAQAILKIPISIMGEKDRLYWRDTKDGQYSVASGYNTAQRLKIRRKGGVGTSRLNTCGETGLKLNLVTEHQKEEPNFYLESMPQQTSHGCQSEKKRGF